jgi:hypothetical protein
MLIIRIGALCAGVVLMSVLPAAAQELCGRTREAPDALYNRLTRTEALKEGFRDKSYATITDTARNVIWTFTLEGHPAHPSVVCRQPVEEPGKDVHINMDVQCGAAEAECEKLIDAFEDLNRRMLQDAKTKLK